MDELSIARDEFITQWGALGSAWGVNRTWSQVHALLFVSNEPLTTDDVMKELKISRGNANTSLRELVGWGLIRGVVRKGERKEYFVAEKNVWKMFCIVIGERKRREVVPALDVLNRCVDQTKNLKGKAARDFHKQLHELGEFMRMGEKIMARVEQSEKSLVMPLVYKFMK